MNKHIPLIPFVLIGCTQPKQQAAVEFQNCTAGEFTYSLNAPDYQISNDTLSIVSKANTDFFNAPDGTARTATAPLLLKEIDNTKPFTFTAKVKPDFQTTYDAGAVYVFCDNDNWLKFAFEMDERKRTRIVTVRTNGTSDDNNHDAVSQKDVYMKISSDTHSIGFYYSLDGREWQLVRLFRNDYPETLHIAVSSQSPIGKGIASQFTEITFTDTNVENFRMGL